MALKKIKNYKKGFGIIEVLVASVIIIIILSALVFVGRAALANSAYVQQRAQAVFLTQEGIELVRQIRDTNWIDGDNATEWDSLVWDNGTPPKLTAVTTGGNYSLTTQNGRFGLSTLIGSGEDILLNNTHYFRAINISPVASNTVLLDNPSSSSINSALNAFKVTVTVSFDNVTGNKSITAGEIITNWRPNF